MLFQTRMNSVRHGAIIRKRVTAFLLSLSASGTVWWLGWDDVGRGDGRGREAKELGVVKQISISGHANLQVRAEAIWRFAFDSALVALSAMDELIYSFMALQYTLSLPVVTAIVGMESMEQLNRNLAAATAFKPMGEIEKLDFVNEVAHLASPDVLRWKARGWTSGEWVVP